MRAPADTSAEPLLGLLRRWSQVARSTLVVVCVCVCTWASVWVLVAGAEHSDDAGVDVDQREATGRQRVAPHWLARRLAPVAVSPRQRGVEQAGDGGQQGTGEDHVEGLSRQQDLTQVVWRGVGEPLHPAPGPAARADWPRGELVADVLGDSLGVGDRQEAVLLVGNLENLGGSLTGEIREL